jgi:hypothetical protein
MSWIHGLCPWIHTFLNSSAILTHAWIHSFILPSALLRVCPLSTDTIEDTFQTPAPTAAPRSERHRNHHDVYAIAFMLSRHGTARLERQTTGSSVDGVPCTS